MHTPHELEDLARDQQNILICKQEYDGEEILTVDFGRNATDLLLDIVGGTAIVVGDSEQFDFEVPTDADEITVNNGILTIRQAIQQ